MEIDQPSPVTVLESVETIQPVEVMERVPDELNAFETEAPMRVVKVRVQLQTISSSHSSNESLPWTMDDENERLLLLAPQSLVIQMEIIEKRESKGFQNFHRSLCSSLSTRSRRRLHLLSVGSALRSFISDSRRLDRRNRCNSPVCWSFYVVSRACCIQQN